MAHDVIISYTYKSERDKKTADAICAALEAEKIRCWIAPRDIIPGKGYGEAIVKAIDESNIMVLVFSRDSNESQHVTREVERAVNKELLIIPFRMDDTIPSGNLEYFLSATHWLDALTPPLQKHIGELVTIVQQLMAAMESETKEPVAPARKPAEAAYPTGLRGFLKSHRTPVSIGLIALIIISVVALTLIFAIPGGDNETADQNDERLYAQETEQVTPEGNQEEIPPEEIEIALPEALYGYWQAEYSLNAIYIGPDTIYRYFSEDTDNGLWDVIWNSYTTAEPTNPEADIRIIFESPSMYLNPWDQYSDQWEPEPAEIKFISSERFYVYCDHMERTIYKYIDSTQVPPQVANR